MLKIDATTKTLTNAHSCPRNEKRIPRHEVRLSRYRRAPTIAIGMKTKMRSDVNPWVTMWIVLSPDRRATALSAVIGNPTNSSALTNPSSSSLPVP